ncbi:MAG: Mov34/MPN/PAD-1 family protein [Elusimicrobia bacterium]|nr:Mov34/MPN/PAD-1 family protein [Elusimicrobiota bacterium]
MSLVWTSSVLTFLKGWSESCYPYEGCGVLLGRFLPDGIRQADRFVPLINQLREKVKAGAGVLATARDTLGNRAETEGQFEFVMDPAEFNRVVLAAEKEGLDVVGVLHTHPDHPARPSATDAAQPLLAGWSNVIVSVQKGQFAEARSWYRDEETAPFVEEVIEVTKESPMSTVLPDDVENEIRQVEENIRALKAGKMEMDDFRRFRLNNGIYGIRNQVDKQMVRIKVPFGKLTPEQLEAMADVTDMFAPSKIGHFTTRQNLQIHMVPLEDTPKIMRRLAEAGLTPREGCGNTVRNITANPYTGVHPQDVFDVAPYADAAFKFFLRNPLSQNLPRKFKIAFESTPTDYALTSIHDMAFVAEIRNGVRGFRTYVGGGLGATPQVAIRLEDFTPADQLMPTIETVVRLFDRFGDRADKLHARIKFLVKKWGADEFRKKFQAERRAVLSTRAGSIDWTIPVVEESAPALPSDVAVEKPAPGYDRWKATNAAPQRQSGYSWATVVLPLGDIPVGQMRELAKISRRLNGGRLRTTVEQNFLLRWVRNEHLPTLYNALVKAGLGTAGGNRLSDITRCPGADTCQIAVTKSRELAIALGGLFTNGLSADVDLEGIHIKISGCTNSCGQHHIGSLGFYGTYRKIGDRPVPHYMMLAGGSTKEGEARFGQVIAALPARRVPDAVKKVIGAYKTERQGAELFETWFDRVGKSRVKELVQEFTILPPYAENPTLYFDWGETADFKPDIGVGECAA